VSFFWHCCWIFLLLLAVYITVGRQFFPAISQLKGRIERVLSEKTGTDVTIGSLNGGWKGFDPVIYLNKLEVHTLSSKNDVVTLNQLYMRFSFFESLKHLQVRFSAIRLNGLSVELQQKKEGRWSLPGMSYQMVANSSDVSHFRWKDFFRLPVLDFSNVTLVLLSQSGKKSTWLIPRAQSVYEGRDFLASGRASSSKNASDFLEFSMKGSGSLLRGDFTGDFYMKWSSGRFFSPYLDTYVWHGLKAEKVDSTGQMWMTWQSGLLNKVQGNLALPSLTLSDNGVPIKPVKDFNTRFFWSHDKTKSTLLLTDLSFKWAGRQWPVSRYLVSKKPKSILIRNDVSDLEILSDLMRSLNKLPGWATHSLQQYDPKGLLKNLMLRIPVAKQTDKSSGFLLQAELNNVSTNAVQGAPAVKGVDGFLEVTRTGGRVLVDSRRFSMAFPHLFKRGWSFRRAELSVDWTMGTQLRIFSNGIRLYLEGKGKILADFNALLSGDPDKEFLTLKLGFKNLDATLAPSFVPFDKNDDSLDKWLRRAIKGGVVTQGLYLGYGAIGANAPAHSFTSSLDLNIQQGRLDFADGWPNLTDLNAQLFLQDSGLWIDKGSAMFRGMPLQNINASLPGRATVKGKKILDITAQAKPTSKDLTYWLTSSPVSQSTAKQAAQFDFTGAFDAALSLKIPLQSPKGKITYAVDLNVQNATIHSRRANLDFKNINGDINIGNNGVTSKDINLTFLGHPSTLALSTLNIGNGIFDQQMTLTGLLDLSDLYTYFDLDSNARIQGSFYYHATLRLPVGKKPLHLRINSPLKNLTLDYPPPLTKKAGRARFGQLDAYFNEQTVNLRMKYGKEVKGHFLFRKGEFQRGAVAIAKTLPAMPVHGLKVDVSLNKFVISPWIALGEEKPKAGSNKNFKQAILDYPIIISARNFDFYGVSFPDTQLSFSREKTGSSLVLKGPDVNGRLFIPKNKGFIKGDFTALHLNTEKKRSDQSKSVIARLSPQDIPALQLHINDFKLNNKDYGNWAFEAVPSNKGVAFKNIKINLAGSVFTGHLSWLQNALRFQTTILTGQVKGGNVESLLKAFDWPQAFRSKALFSDIGFTWSGSPLDFDIAKVSGRIDLKLEKGRYNRSQKATDAMKIFGILNMNAIKRRLNLDFTDLYRKGVSFDNVEGAARIDKGVMSFVKPLLFHGPTNNFKFTGKVNLVSHQVDMKMVVVLPLTQNLPLAAVALGAPQIGGALWIVSKLFGPELNKLASATYLLTGNWNHLNVTLENLFDQTGSNNSKNSTSGR